MSAHDVGVEIITPMRAVFATPRRMDDEAERVALREYVNALERYDSDALRRAWAKVRETWARSSWPPIAEIVRFAREARKDMPQPDEPERPKMCWEHGPMCTKCLRKERSANGFFVAKGEDYRRDQATRDEIDIWFRSLVGSPSP